MEYADFKVLMILLTFIMIPIAIGVSIYLDCKKAKKEAIEKKQREEDWLKEEMEKPRFFLELTLKDGKMLQSEDFEPYYDYYWPGYYRVTSQERAISAQIRYLKGENIFTSKQGESFSPTTIRSVMVRQR